MTPRINLTLASAESKQPIQMELPDFCKFPIRFTSPNLINIQEGDILQQSYTDNFAAMDLFEFSFRETATVQFKVDEPSVCILIMLSGKMEMPKLVQKGICCPKGSYCRLYYTNACTNLADFNAGNHKMLFISINKDWFKTNTENYPALQPVSNNLESPDRPYLYLPACVVIRDIVRAIERLESRHLHDEIKRKLAIELFLRDVIRDYNALLSERRYVAEQEDQLKAEELRLFVLQNFAKDIVLRREEIADALIISISRLLRLSIKAFKMPLHEYVTHVRITMAFKELTFTNKSIKEIANHVGYEDPLHFSKVFKKLYTIPPNQVIRPSRLLEKLKNKNSNNESA